MDSREHNMVYRVDDIMSETARSVLFKSLFDPTQPDTTNALSECLSDPNFDITSPIEHESWVGEPIPLILKVAHLRRYQSFLTKRMAFVLEKRHELFAPRKVKCTLCISTGERVDSVVSMAHMAVMWPELGIIESWGRNNMKMPIELLGIACEYCHPLLYYIAKLFADHHDHNEATVHNEVDTHIFSTVLRYMNADSTLFTILRRYFNQLIPVLPVDVQLEIFNSVSHTLYRTENRSRWMRYIIHLGFPMTHVDIRTFFYSLFINASSNRVRREIEASHIIDAQSLMDAKRDFPLQEFNLQDRMPYIELYRREHP